MGEPFTFTLKSVHMKKAEIIEKEGLNTAVKFSSLLIRKCYVAASRIRRWIPGN